jgi:uncharacterized protein YfaP (DUF2135 family)
MEKATIGFAVVLLSALLFAALSRPACSEGYMSLFSPINGWVCLAGYKPQQ